MVDTKDTELSEEMTPEDVEAYVRERIWAVHRMTPEDYFAAKAAGTLKRKPGDAGIEIISGEIAAKLAARGAK